MSLWAFRFVLFYLTILIVQPQNRFPFLWGFRIALISMIIAIVLHVISASQESKPVIRFGPATITALLVLVFAFISQHFGAFQRTSGWNADIDIIFKNCVCLILIEAMATTVERVWAVFGAMLIATLWWIKGGLRISAAGATYAGDRLWSPSVSLIENPNGFAFMMSVMIPIYLFFFLNAKDRYLRWGSLFCAVSAVYIALETGSRTGLLCIIACGLLILPKFSVKRPGTLAMVAVAIFFIFGSIGALNIERYKTIPQSFANFFSGEKLAEKDPSEMSQDEQSAWERKMKNKHSWALIKMHPVFGVGIHKDDRMLPPELNFADGQVHNEWLYIGVQMGFVGMILYAVFHIIILISSTLVKQANQRTWPVLADMGWMVRVFLGVYLVGGFFSPVGWNPILLMVTGATSALWTNCENRSWNRETERT